SQQPSQLAKFEWVAVTVAGPPNTSVTTVNPAPPFAPWAMTFVRSIVALPDVAMTTIAAPLSAGTGGTLCYVPVPETASVTEQMGLVSATTRLSRMVALRSVTEHSLRPPPP